MSEEQATFTGSTIAAMEAARPRRLLQWAVRSVISATILVWLSSRYPWTKWILYVWMVMAALGLALILFLPQLIRNRMEMLERRMMDGLDPTILGGDLDIEDREITQPVPLETQLDEFAQLGVELAAGRSPGDLEAVHGREVLEDRPYVTLLMALGTEVDGDSHCLSDRVWNFDARCIEGSGSYVSIVRHLARIAGAESRVAEIQDSVDHENETATLSYSLDGELKELQPSVSEDWADGGTMTEIMTNLAGPEHGFYGVDNGSGSVIVYLSKDNAKPFTELLSCDVLLIA